MDLYFYTHLEDEFYRFRITELLAGRLVLSSPHRFNDPFDSRLNLNHSDLTGDEVKKRLETRGPVFGEFSDEQLVSIEAFSRESIYKNYRMFCFSEIRESLLMWSHYARSHTGICLKLKVDRSNLEDRHSLKQVRYTTHYPEINGKDVENSDLEALNTLLLTKSVDWLYEKEWRLITKSFQRNHDRKDDVGYMEVGGDPARVRVEEVYLGLKFNELSVIRNNWCAWLGGSSETIFDLLKNGDKEKLEQLSQGSDDLKTAIGRERVLMDFKDADIPVFECQKKKGCFNLDYRPFDYSSSTSLRVDLGKVPKEI
jgi:hypothetical protein